MDVYRNHTGRRAGCASFPSRYVYNDDKDNVYLSLPARRSCEKDAQHAVVLQDAVLCLVRHLIHPGPSARSLNAIHQNPMVYIVLQVFLQVVYINHIILLLPLSNPYFDLVRIKARQRPNTRIHQAIAPSGSIGAFQAPIRATSLSRMSCLRTQVVDYRSLLRSLTRFWRVSTISRCCD